MAGILSNAGQLFEPTGLQTLIGFTVSQGPELQYTASNLKSHHRCSTLDAACCNVPVVQGVGGQAPRSLMEYFAEVLLCLNRHCHSPMTVWLQEVMLIPNFPSARVSMEQKQTFSQQILR